MFSLAILLFVHGSTGSFLAAGLAVGAFTLAGAAIGPLLGALVDRHGQTRVLLASGGRPGGAAGGAGARRHRRARRWRRSSRWRRSRAARCRRSRGCVRALWSEVAHGEELETAYALDATTQETIWTLGPLLVGTTAGFALARRGRAAVRRAHGLRNRLLRDLHALPRMARGSRRAQAGERAERQPQPAHAALHGRARGRGDRSGRGGAARAGGAAGARWSSGPLLALFSLGSMTGGLIYSARSWALPIGRRYTVILMAMAIAVAPLIAVHSLAAVFGLSVLAGLCAGADDLLPVLARRGARAGGDRHGGVHLAPRRHRRRHGRGLGVGGLADRRARRRLRPRLSGADGRLVARCALAGAFRCGRDAYGAPCSGVESAATPTLSIAIRTRLG